MAIIYDLVVLNGLVVTHDETGEFDIAVKDGKIAKVVKRGGLGDVEAKKMIDAKGGMVMVSFLEKSGESERSLLMFASLEELMLMSILMSLRYSARGEVRIIMRQVSRKHLDHEALLIVF